MDVWRNGRFDLSREFAHLKAGIRPRGHVDMMALNFTLDTISFTLILQRKADLQKYSWSQVVGGPVVHKEKPILSVPLSTYCRKWFYYVDRHDNTCRQAWQCLSTGMKTTTMIMPIDMRCRACRHNHIFSRIQLDKMQNANDNGYHTFWSPLMRRTNCRRLRVGKLSSLWVGDGKLDLHRKG